jgi:hypothetical protein
MGTASLVNLAVHGRVIPHPYSRADLADTPVRSTHLRRRVSM